MYYVGCLYFIVVLMHWLYRQLTGKEPRHIAGYGNIVNIILAFRQVYS